MYRILIVAMLFACGTLSAQQLPERALVRKGNRQYNKGNYERSIERYTQALEADPASFEALYDLGNALCRAERYETATQTMQRAAADSLRSDEERAGAFYNLGNALFQQKKYKEALDSYRKSLLLNPSDMEAKYNYAYTKRLLDDQEQNGGGGGDNDREQNDDQQQQQQPQGGDGGQDDRPQQPKPQDGGQQPSDPSDGKSDPSDRQGEPQRSENGISEQEQQQMLDAIQAQEDRTQEKLKEKQGVVVRGKKNW